MTRRTSPVHTAERKLKAKRNPYWKSEKKLVPEEECARLQRLGIRSTRPPKYGDLLRRANALFDILNEDEDAEAENDNQENINGQRTENNHCPDNEHGIS